MCECDTDGGRGGDSKNRPRDLAIAHIHSLVPIHPGHCSANLTVCTCLCVCESMLLTLALNPTLIIIRLVIDHTRSQY